MNVCYMRCYLLIERDNVKSRVEVNNLMHTVDMLFGSSNLELFLYVLRVSSAY